MWSYYKLIKDITYSVTVAGNPVKVTNIEVSEAFKSPVAKASFTTNAVVTDDWLGDSVTIALGYGDDNTTVFVGQIDNIVYTRLPGTYEITCSNILDRAVKYYIVTQSLENPWTRSNIAAEDLVGALLAEAGLTTYNGYASGFTFGVWGEVEFNLLSSMDAINQINNILATNIYAINDTVFWDNTQPVPSTATHTVELYEKIMYSYGTRDLRNKVVVFGKNGIYAEASAESPYLPGGFYQTAIVSSELIDQQSMADAAAGYNLSLYNKLTEELKVDIEGDASIRVRDTARVISDKLGMDENWFVYSVKHSFNETFITSLIMRR